MLPSQLQPSTLVLTQNTFEQTTSNLVKKESTEDTAKVLGRMFDGLNSVVSANVWLKNWLNSQVFQYGMVWLTNGTQLKCLQTTWLFKKTLDALKVWHWYTVVTDVTTLQNSLLVTGAILGVNVHIFSPKELFPEQRNCWIGEGFAKESGAHILITEDADEAVKGADVLYTDVWVSMGEEDKFAERVALLKPYQVNMELIKKADNEDLIFLHCLPAFHDTNTVYGKDVAEKFGVEEMEVTDEVFRSKYARHFDQAENRMHTIKAVMAATLGNLYIPKV